MNGRITFRGVFWVVIALVLLAHLAAGWMFSGRMIREGFTPDPAPVVVPSGDFELEEISYETPLGPMDAWYLPAPASTWVIHVHGLNNTPAEPEVVFPAIQDAGYPQLSITYRNDEGQPTDPSGYFQYGETEWEDVRGAVEYARANGAEQMVFMGYGTGASHVLSYIYQHQLEEVAGVVTDSANIDMGSTVDFQASQEELPLIPVEVPPTMVWVAKFFTSLRIDVNWQSIDYIEKATRSLRVPVLAIYGTEDQSVPGQLSIDLAAAQPDLVDLLAVQGAGHVQSFDVDYQGYVDRVLEFLADVT